MACILLGLPVREGTGRAGADQGPRALRAAGLREALGASGAAVEDWGDLRLDEAVAVAHPNSALKALPEVAAWTRAIARVAASVPSGKRAVFLGGDHSISLGTLAGMSLRAARLRRPLFVLWIDAHPDCHTLETTTSGHLHGTPLAYATGEGGFERAFPAIAHPVDPANICMVGIRSVDPAEAALIARRGMAVHGVDSIAAHGPGAILQRFFEKVRRADGLLHVSFDVDAVDPGAAPGVGTPVENGLSVRLAHDIMAQVRESGLMDSLDLVELNPFLDRDRRTARLMVDLAATAFGRPSAASLRSA
jgi:arginase